MTVLLLITLIKPFNATAKCVIEVEYKKGDDCILTTFKEEKGLFFTLERAEQIKQQIDNSYLDKEQNKLLKEAMEKFKELVEIKTESINRLQELDRINQQNLNRALQEVEESKLWLNIITIGFGIVLTLVSGAYITTLINN